MYTINHGFGRTASWEVERPLALTVGRYFVGNFIQSINQSTNCEDETLR
jgi:hypothetical protein